VRYHVSTRQSSASAGAERELPVHTNLAR